VPPAIEEQKDINGKMRAILVDWLVEVHMKYKLRVETLFLACNLIDRYLSKVQVARKRLQLVGVVAMLVAAKFEETSSPEVSDFVFITDNAYTKDEVLSEECAMLQALDFRVARVTPIHFLQRLTRAIDCSGKHASLARYIIELALLDVHYVRYSPSHVAAAALLLANELMRCQVVWPAHVATFARHSQESLHDCVDAMRTTVRQVRDNSKLQAVRKKFSQTQRHSVANLV